MNAPLLVLAIRNKRDIVQARQRIRQTAGLLGFDHQEQSGLASAVFEIACKLRQQSRAGEIRLHVEADALHLIAYCPDGEATPPHATLHLQRPLPTKALNFTSEDLAWAVVELELLTPLNLFDEIHQQNQELLLLVRDLQACQAEVARLRHERSAPTAA